MALARNGRILRINNELVPDYALRPMRTAGVLHPMTTATDQTGRPVGARGWASITLTWERMSVRGVQWWESKIGESFNSAPVTQLLLPDKRSTQRIEGYLYHSKFGRGTLWRIEVDPSANLVVYNNEMWYEGAITLRITELNRGAV